MRTRTTVAGLQVTVHTEQDNLTGKWGYRIEKPIVDKPEGNGYDYQSQAIYGALGEVGRKRGMAVAIGAAVVGVAMVVAGLL